MIRKTVPSKTKKYTYYVCAGAKHKNGCTSHSISVKEVETAVLHAIHDHVELVFSVDAALERANQLPSAKRVIFNYEAQITKLEEEIERFQGLKLRLYEDLADGVINKEDFSFHDSPEVLDQLLTEHPEVEFVQIIINFKKPFPEETVLLNGEDITAQVKETWDLPVGNTEVAAKKIYAMIDSDLFYIDTVQKYPDEQLDGFAVWRPSFEPK